MDLTVDGKPAIAILVKPLWKESAAEQEEAEFMPGKRWIGGVVLWFALSATGCAWWGERQCCAPYQSGACCVPVTCYPAPAACAPAGAPAPANTSWQRPQPGCCQ